MSARDAFERVTTRPAAILGLAGEVGTLAPGACADLAALAWSPAAPPLRDTTGMERPGGVWAPVLTVRAGAVIPPRAASPA
jgi:dihydroorotase